MFCPACGKEAPEQSKFCQNCGQPLSWEGAQPGIAESGASRPAIVRYAGFWNRFVAYLIDGILVFIVGTGAGAVVGFLLGVNVALRGGGAKQGAGTVIGFVVGTLTSWLYWSIMESSAKQATLGKMALGLKVTDLKGEPISFARATGRYFGKFISSLILCVGFMMAGWTEKKQALHDIMAGCLVIKQRS